MQTTCSSNSSPTVSFDGTILGKRSNSSEELPEAKKQDEEVRWYDDLSEFETLCEKASQLPTFSKRWEQFHQLFTQLGNTSQMWLSPHGETGKEHFECTLSHGPFHSRSFDERFIRQLHPDCTNDEFFFLTVKEFDGTGESLLEMSLSQDGSIGELSWIQKGENVSGSAVLDLFKLFEKTLKIGSLYLYDDAKLGHEKKYPLKMRRIYPIASSNGLPWYQEKAGFRPLPHPGIIGTPSPNPLRQSPEEYSQAVQFLRDLPLKELSAIAKYAGQKPFLTKICAKHPTATTIHELLGAIQQKSKEGDPEALADLKNFEKHFLEVYNVKKPNDLEVRYLQYLVQLENTCVFVKN